MPSTHIKRLDIALESSYMNRNADGEPSDSGLTWMACEFADASQIVAFGDTQTLEYNASTGGFGVNPGEALVDPLTGVPVKRGSMSIDFYLRGGLTNYRKGLLALLCSRLVGTEQTAKTTASMSVNATSVEVPTAVSGGQFLAWMMSDNRVSYALSTNTSSSTSPNVTPPPNTAASFDTDVSSPAATGASKICSYKIPASGGDPISYGTGTVALRLTGDGWQQLCFGCALTALSITADGDGRAIKLSATVDCPYIQDVRVSVDAPGFPTVTDGPILHSLGSPARIQNKDSNEILTGMGGGPCIAAWTLNLSWTTAGSACGSYWSGRAPLEATALEATLDLTIGTSPYATIDFFESAWRNQSQLSVLLPFGGDLNSTSPRPFGGAIILPAAVVADGSFLNPDLSGDAVQSTVSLRLTDPGTNQYVPLFCLGII